MPAPKGTRLNNRGGVWYIVWTGNSRGRSTGTGDRTLAEAALAAFIHERERDRTDRKGRLTVAGALDYYVAERVPKVADPERILWIVPNLAAHFGDAAVEDVTDDLVSLYAERRQRGDIGQPAGAGTIRRELGCLIAAFNHNVRANVRPRRLMPAEVPPIALPEAPPPKDRWLTREEATRLLAVAQPETEKRLTRAYRFIQIGLATGARRRSIETLTWFQVDLEGGIIHFNPPGRRQTKKRRVPVPISDALRAVLERAWQERTGEHVLDNDGSIRRTFETAVRDADLPGVTRHTLRHTFATWAAQAGVDMWKIAGVLGDDERTVRSKYAHHHPDYLRDAVNFEAPSWPDRATGTMKVSKDDGS